jgi:TM2 domain-containing membrane protein YozV
MDYRAFEQRLLDTIFTTDVQLTPATIAFLYKLSVQDASDLLQQAAVAGLLNIESDDDGNLLYTYPNRTRLPKDGVTSPPASAETQRDTQRDLAIYRPDPAQVAPYHRPPLSLLPDYNEGQNALSPESALPSELGQRTQPAGQQTTRCPFCNEPIIVGAKKCKHCHEYLDYALRDIHARNHGVGQVSVAIQAPAQNQALAQWTGTQAALLSFFMPGLGQMCTGRVPAGILWLMFTTMGYICFIVPGAILHLLCIINATRQPRPAT